jgi:hypothetical protein
MEEIVSLVARFIGDAVLEIVIGRLFFWIGWPFVKLATFGKYPGKFPKENSREEIYVACVGLAVFVITVLAALAQFSL